MSQPTAVVMNMFYTGLGIARSLGENGIPVIGLTSHRGIYGNFTRYAKVISCPDSKDDPEGLLPFLIELGRGFEERGVIFPTRDADLVFLDRFRAELEPYFAIAAPDSAALGVCLDKWETYLAAKRAGIGTPRCWMAHSRDELEDILPGLAYPCVLKPVLAQDWRAGGNWAVVGSRKAIPIANEQELLATYDVVSRAAERVLLQELIPGGNECLFVTACYFDRQSEWVAGFYAQKLIQEPEGFGTGCIVQSADRPELFEPTVALLQSIGFTGIAEVEYKWDAARREYRLIEINPRPWDQHRLGNCCGANLVHIAYCDCAGLPRPRLQTRASAQKWIAEDTFVVTALRLLFRRDPRLFRLFRLAKGRRTYAIWSARDPLPLLGYLVARFLPGLAGSGWQALRAAWRGRTRPAATTQIASAEQSKGVLRQ